MSRQYDLYLAEHISNHAKGVNWLVNNLKPVLYDNGLSFIDLYNMPVHDSSKKKPDEYHAYDVYFYGGERTQEVIENFNKAWLSHIHKNPHHWQHWILIDDYPGQGEIVLEMPCKYIIDMICDWWAFSWAKGKLFEVFFWYDERKELIRLHPNTREKVESILVQMKNKLNEQEDEPCE